jgi:hypothetical protein
VIYSAVVTNPRNCILVIFVTKPIALFLQPRLTPEGYRRWFCIFSYVIHLRLYDSSSSSSIGSTTLVGSGLLNSRWAFSAGRVYRVPLPAARQTLNLEENQRFRAFQLSPKEAPSVWSDGSEPSSGRWHYGREMAENFAESDDFHVTFGVFYMP